MSNYQNGKIYKITSPNTDMIYVGSTTTSLNRRLISHRYRSKKYNGNNSSSNMFIWGDPQIELLENYSCNNKKELILREQYYIDLYSDYCVNCRKAFLTNTQNIELSRIQANNYYRNNREILKIKVKAYREKNKELVLLKKKVKYQYIVSMGGDPRHNNNLTKIDTNIFS